MRPRRDQQQDGSAPLDGGCRRSHVGLSPGEVPVGGPEPGTHARSAGEVAPLPNWGRVTMPRSGVPGHRVECRAVPPEPPATRPRLARVGSYLEGNQALLSGMLAATRNEWDVAGYGRLAGGRLAG